MPRLRAESISQHKAVTRDAILDAAGEAFVRFGYEGTSFSVIADLSELPRSSLYEYFPNVDEVLCALIEERVIPALNEWLATLPFDPPIARVEAMFATALRGAGSHPHRSSLMLAASRYFPEELTRDRIPLLAQLRNDIVDTCVRAVADGSFADTDPEGLAAVLGSLLSSGVSDIVSAPDPAGAVQAKLEVLLQLVRHGALSASSHANRSQRRRNPRRRGIRSVAATAG